ncbi:MAG: cation-translocating P-type ATPase [Thermoleophilia bacterium]
MPDGHRTVSVPVSLPAQAECRNCSLRLKETMEGTKGVSQVDMAERGGTMTVSFDPDLLTPRSLEERVKVACGRLADTYCHRSLVLGGLDCADCARSIERAVVRREGVLYASVNFATSRLFMEFDCSEIPLEEVKRDVRSLGYEVWTDEEYKQHRKSAVPRPFFLRNRRALFTLVSFLFLIAGTAVWLLGDAPHLIAKVIFTVGIVVGGHLVARNGFSAIVRTRNVDMNVLMTVAVVGAVAVGEWIEAALVVTLFGLGETLESWAVERTRGSIQQLMELAPDEALIRHDDHEERVPVEQVTVGAHILVKPGARISLDGVVTEGSSAVDESPITGESFPQSKGEGDQVYAGTINQRGSLVVRVTSAAGDSTLARLIALVEEAQGQKAPAQRWVDSFAAYYTPAVMVLATLTALGPPLLLGASFSDWLYRALALLILACPCALVISTPVSIVSAIGAAGRQGVLIKGGTHLEAAGGVKAVAFDKTGTLTQGTPRVTGTTPIAPHTREHVLALAGAVERDSEHPLAEAILHAAAALDGRMARAEGFEAIPGLGARAWVEGALVHVGNSRLLAQLDTDIPTEAAADLAAREARAETAVLVARDGEVVGVIGVADAIRPASRAAVEQLRAAGVEKVLMLTGDNRATAAAVAAELGLDDYRAELLPDQKVDAVRELQAAYGAVAMVGDGINDAPALAAATVGIAMGAAGTDTALETADIALMADDLSKVPFTIRLSRATRATVRQNIGFALGLKLATLLLVFPGWLTLWMAVLADTGGSLVVIANGLRLLRHGRDLEGSPVGLPDRQRTQTAPVESACATAGCACSLGDDHDHGHPDAEPEHDHAGHGDHQHAEPEHDHAGHSH